MTTKTKLKAAAYIRVSTAGQAEEGSSLPEQRETITARIAAEGWELVEVYADEGLSGKTEDRKELQRLLAGLPKLDRVVVTELSRLGRRAAGMLELFDRLEDNDVALVSIRQSIDTSTAAGRLLRNVLVSVAEFESEQLGERVAAVTRSKVAKGSHHGHCPYGYKKSKADGLTLHPTESKIVKRMFEEAGAGKTQRAISRKLNADGIKPLRAKAWKQSSVRRILANPTYKGVLVLNGDEFAGTHDPIVTTELWDEVAVLRRKRTRTKEGAGPGRTPAGAHLFTRGLLRCGICGGAMTPRSDGGREDYRCLTRIEQGTDACPQEPIERKVIDSAALAYFEEVGLDADKLRNEIALAVDDRKELVSEQLREAVAEERKAAERVERIRRDYADEKIDAEDWRSLRDQFQGELDGARAALAQAEGREAALVEAEEDAANPESEATARLEAIRDAIAGKVTASQDDLEALRHALTAMFAAFYVLPTSHTDAARAELDDDEARAAASVRKRLEKREAFDFDFDGYRVFPQPREEALAGIDAVFEPLLKRRSIGPGTTEHDGLQR